MGPRYSTLQKRSRVLISRQGGQQLRELLGCQNTIYTLESAQESCSTTAGLLRQVPVRWQASASLCRRLHTLVYLVVQLSERLGAVQHVLEICACGCLDISVVVAARLRFCQKQLAAHP